MIDFDLRQYRHICASDVAATTIQNRKKNLLHKIKDSKRNKQINARILTGLKDKIKDRKRNKEVKAMIQMRITRPLLFLRSQTTAQPA
jgi:hypothetical protein